MVDWVSMDAETKAILDLLSPVDRQRFEVSAQEHEEQPTDQAIGRNTVMPTTEPHREAAHVLDPLIQDACDPSGELSAALLRAVEKRERVTRRRFAKAQSVAKGKHVAPVTMRIGPAMPPPLSPSTPPPSRPLSGFNDLTKGVPNTQELLAATSELLRKFHGRAFADGGTPGKQAAVAFGVLVDKITLLRSQAAAPIAAEDAEQHREGVLRLVQRVSTILGDANTQDSHTRKTRTEP